MLDILTEQGLAYFSTLFMFPFPSCQQRSPLRDGIPDVSKSPIPVPNPIPRTSFFVYIKLRKNPYGQRGIGFGTGICDL